MMSAASSEDDMIQHVKALERKNAKRDMKMLIRELLEMPVANGRTYTLEDVGSITELSRLNTDVRTRILISVANDAARGDIKAAELLLKYGGYTPAIEQNVSVRLPQIVNDLRPPEDALESDDVVTIEAPVRPINEILLEGAVDRGFMGELPQEDDGPPPEFERRMKVAHD